MVTFDHRSDGTPERDWIAALDARMIPQLDLQSVESLVVVAAHPDDESLGAGGLLARVSALDLPVRVVVATDGGASHPDSPTTTPVHLAEIRRAELERAVAAVAPSAEIDFLGLPDGELRDHMDVLREHLTGLRLTDHTLVVAPWRYDRHGDHEAAGTVAAVVAREAGARFLEYPVWMWHWARPETNDIPSDLPSQVPSAVPWGRMVRLELAADESAAKSLAVSAHVSQNLPLSPAVGDETLLDEAFRAHFDRPFEVFLGPERAETLTEEFFDAFYDGEDDPWGFETRWYEMRKRAITLALLPRPSFTSALEIGCSIGVLTAELASRTKQLLAIDIAERPLQRARARLADQSHVSFLRADASSQWPAGSFDLIVLSEVGYYWSPEDLLRVTGATEAALTPDGVLVACHWRHPVVDYPERGDAVHATLRASPGFALVAQYEDEDVLVDVFVKPPARSVARETGLL